MTQMNGFPAQVTFRCDGCGREAPGVHYGNGAWHKPATWFVRGDEDGQQIACSRTCIDKIADATGKTRVKLPF